jgi:putative membrane protein
MMRFGHFGHFGHFGGPGPGSGIGFFFFILMILFFAALIWALLSATHHRDVHGHSRLSSHPHGPHADHHGQESEARKILDHRFAAGEINEEEYLRRRNLLDGGS